MPNGPGSLDPGPCTYTVAAPSGALPGPSFSSVTRTTCSGRCTVPMNKSVDSTTAIRMASVLPGGTTPRIPPILGEAFPPNPLGLPLAGGMPAPPYPLGEPPGEGPRRTGWVVGLGDGPDDDDAGGSRGEHLVEPGQADPADREPGTGGRRVRHVPQQAEA